MGSSFLGCSKTQLQSGDEDMNPCTCLLPCLTWGLSLPGLPQATDSDMQEADLNSKRTLYLCEPREESEFCSLGMPEPLRGAQLL